MDDRQTDWHYAKVALKNFEDLLRCSKCSTVVKDPHNYSCGHFFCHLCVTLSETLCPVCKVPSQSNEITPDRLMSVMVSCFYKLASVILPERSLNAAVSNDVETKDLQVTSKLFLSEVGQETIDISKITEHSVEFEPKSTPFADVLEEKTLDSSFFKCPVNRVNTRTRSSTQSSLDVSVDVEVPPKPTRARRSGSKRLSTSESRNTENISPPNARKRKSSLSGTMSLAKKEQGNGSRSITGDTSVTPKRMSSRSKKYLPNSPGSSRDVSKQESITIASAAVLRKKRTSHESLEKQNKKGETPLHVACIKGDIEKLRSLLNQKANPNTKDYAGWTPLHEAALNGNLEIAKMLLEARALVNVPGDMNATSLHEAVKKGHVAMAHLLVSFGANVNAPASDGKTPLDLAESEEMRETLLTTEVISQPLLADVTEGHSNSTTLEDLVLCGAPGLSNQEKTKLKHLAQKLNAKISSSFGSEVTHLVVPTDNHNTCPPSVEVISAILCGIQILNRDWLTMHDGSLELNNDLFELSGVVDFEDACAPKRSRLNAEQQLPGLLNGCHFYLTSNASYKMGKCSFTRPQLITLIKFGGGAVLSRQPNPESIPQSERTVPYHASRTGPLASTSHFIIYCPGRGEPELKYNMKHCKTLTVEWLINCFLNWKLIDP